MSPDNKWESSVVVKSSGIKSSGQALLFLSCELGQIISFLQAAIPSSVNQSVIMVPAKLGFAEDEMG